MRNTRITTMVAVALGAASASYGQTATLAGVLNYFEIINNSGSPAHGFEIQLEGATTAVLYYATSNARYGMPAIVPYSTGVNVRYSANYNGGTWSSTTPNGTVGGAFGWQDCYLGGSNYVNSGCEIFGHSLRSNVGITPTGYWLIEDPNNPGQLIRGAATQIPFVNPVLLFSSSSAPVVQVTVPAPVPPPPPAQFSDAVWMKVFKTSVPRSVNGDELVLSNTAVVPDSASQIETNWVLLQKAPPGVQNRRGKGVHSAQSTLAINDGAHVRRAEVYKYTGAYDSLTHEAVCADGFCNAPAANELGSAISANNNAANAVADSLTVTKSGSALNSGSVTVGSVTCNAASCANYQTAGSVVSLIAKPGSGSVFSAWTGACTGSALSCSVTVNGKTTVDASFLKVFTLSVGRSNSGTVLVSPNGIDRALNCGSACSAKFADGTAVAITAVPAAGKTFVNWSGACTGTDPTCTLTITDNTSVTAVFSK
ncbi:MAG: hypothetical protein U0Q16_17145 [Bryobacteraceae bacterium]